MEYRCKGLSLWPSLIQDKDQGDSYALTQARLQLLHGNDLCREPHESIDAYWNRYNDLIRKIQQDKNAPPLSKQFLRQRFLTTPGTEFEWIKDKIMTCTLDQDFYLLTDEQLKSKLRTIHKNLKAYQPSPLSKTSNNVPTIGSYSGSIAFEANAANHQIEVQKNIQEQVEMITSLMKTLIDTKDKTRK